MRLGLVLPLAGLALLAGCATQSLEEARTDLTRYLERCTAETGYDPETAPKAEPGLLPGEREFLQCAYRGVETLLIPSTSIPDDYRRLMAEHRAMTEAVAAGAMTRTERRARTAALAEAIKRKEEEARREQLQRLAELQDQMAREQLMMELQQQIQRMNHLPTVERALLGR
jgi:hypothetical protein